MRDWLKKDPENLYYFISFVILFGAAAVCLMTIAAMFE